MQNVMALLHEELLHYTVWIRRLRCRYDRICAADLRRPNGKLQPKRHLLRWCNQHHYCNNDYIIRLHDISTKCYHVTLASSLFFYHCSLFSAALFITVDTPYAHRSDENFLLARGHLKASLKLRKARMQGFLS